MTQEKKKSIQNRQKLKQKKKIVKCKNKKCVLKKFKMINFFFEKERKWKINCLLIKPH